MELRPAQRMAISVRIGRPNRVDMAKKNPALFIPVKVG